MAKVSIVSGNKVTFVIGKMQNMKTNNDRQIVEGEIFLWFEIDLHFLSSC